jgi:hypothetical protein
MYGSNGTETTNVHHLYPPAPRLPPPPTLRTTTTKEQKSPKDAATMSFGPHCLQNDCEDNRQHQGRQTGGLETQSVSREPGVFFFVYFLVLLTNIISTFAGTERKQWQQQTVTITNTTPVHTIRPRNTKNECECAMPMNHLHDHNYTTTALKAPLARP